MRRGELDLRELKKSYGIGASIHTFTSTIVRAEVARGGEGTTFSLSFSPSF